MQIVRQGVEIVGVLQRDGVRTAAAVEDQSSRRIDQHLARLRAGTPVDVGVIRVLNQRDVFRRSVAIESIGDVNAPQFVVVRGVLRRKVERVANGQERVLINADRIHVRNQ